MRMIDADALFEDCMFSSLDFELGLKEFINDAPTIDAVPVTRCKACKERDETGWCEPVLMYTQDMFFCAWGERKDDKSHPFADDVMMGERKDDEPPDGRL